MSAPTRKQAPRKQAARPLDDVADDAGSTEASGAEAADAPAKLPPALLAQIHANTLKVMESAEMKEALGKQLISVVTSKSPAEYAKFVNEDIAKWAAVIRDNNITLD